MNTFKNILVASTLAVCFAGSAVAQDYALRFQTADPAGTPAFKIQAAWAETIETLSGGRITMEILPVGSIVEYSETLDAVAAGIIDGHITDMSYWAGKDPAFSLLGNPVGAWASPDQMLRFYEFGGGLALVNEIMEPYGAHVIGVLTTGLEAFVSKVPLDGVADLKGLKMRAPEGLVQNIFAAAGAAPVNLPFSEVFTSLDKGVIDAADATVFAGNHSAGLHDIARHPVYPGFHSMPTIEVSITKTTWDGMSPELQTLMEFAVRELAFQEISQLDMLSAKAAAEASAMEGMVIHNWSAEERAKFRAIATEQWKAVAKGSDNAQKAYDTILAYLLDQGLIAQ
ncbi:MAG: TRAP transporter substrate-binding protein [Rhizobiales bacterium]|nr:TRAP transporter substrate-binding protein [Hyphomicrobiales bacterium]